MSVDDLHIVRLVISEKNKKLWNEKAPSFLRLEENRVQENRVQENPVQENCVQENCVQENRVQKNCVQENRVQENCVQKDWVINAAPIHAIGEGDVLADKKPLSAESERKEETAVLIVSDCEQEEPFLGWIPDLEEYASFSNAQYVFVEPEDLTKEYAQRVYRRYKNLPWEIMRTARCLLRETTCEDVDYFEKIYNKPGMTAYTDPLYAPISREKEYIRDYIQNVYGFYGFGIWTVIHTETNQIIGRIGLEPKEGGIPELGFLIDRDWQGMGLALEICSKVLEYGFVELDFEQINCLVHRDNTRALSLCQRLGGKIMGQEGELVSLCFCRK